ncbi:MAG TPA: hypothetical protein VIG30_09445 [Ktedonobacterales bacterium]|jgi:hypothetical protein
MSTNVQPRSKDHFSVRLRLPRPGARTGSPAAVIILAIIEAILLYLTVSSVATNGALYGCPAACTTLATSIPFSAMLLGVALIIIPVAVGLFSATWKVAIAMTFLPVLLVLILKGGSKLLAPDFTGSGLTLQTAPFWADFAKLSAVLFTVILFTALGWLGWLIREALADL